MVTTVTIVFICVVTVVIVVLIAIVIVVFIVIVTTVTSNELFLFSYPPPPRFFKVLAFPATVEMEAWPPLPISTLLSESAPTHGGTYILQIR